MVTTGKDRHVTNDTSKPAKDLGLSPGRRAFLKATAASVALPYWVPAAAMGAGETIAPSNRIVMAGIGIGNMGRGDLGAFLGRDDVQYVAVCDVKREARDGCGEHERCGGDCCPGELHFGFLRQDSSGLARMP